ncbi:MAG: AAA domain-containing protein [Candidatus Helarchaeota archaeon]
MSELYWINLQNYHHPEFLYSSIGYRVEEFRRYLINARKGELNKIVKSNFELINPRDYPVREASPISINKKHSFNKEQEIGFEIDIETKEEPKDIIFAKKIADFSHKYPNSWIIQLKETDQEDNQYIAKSKFQEFVQPRVILQQRDEKSHVIKSFNVLDHDPEFELIILDKQPEIKKGVQRKIFIKPNDYQITRQLYALEDLLLKPHETFGPLLSLFDRSKSVKWSHILENEDEIDWKILTEEKKEGTDEQRKFVKIALNTPEFAILEGPPGSGKTTTILEIIYQFLKRKKKILLVASTHPAVDNILEKIDESKYAEELKRLIIPLRIGKSDRISEHSEKYLIDNLAETKTFDLIKQLKGISNRSEAQNYFLKSLQNSVKKKGYDRFHVIKKTIIRTANLVCGTTIGILKHPDIYAHRGAPNPEFDVMIIDEASKTTFTEFLVPAIHSKRWIIVGDTKQLSPFVSQDELIANLTQEAYPNLDPISRQTLLDISHLFEPFRNYLKLKSCSGINELNSNFINPWKKIEDCLDITENLFKRKNKQNEKGKIIKRLGVISNNESELNCYIYESTGKDNLIAYDLRNLENYRKNNEKIPIQEQAKLLSANIIVGTIDNWEKNSNIIPHSIFQWRISDNFDINLLKKLNRRFLFWICSSSSEIRINKCISEKWAEEIAWRINRVHDTRNDPNRQETVKKQLELILPNTKKITNYIQQILKIAVPSVIEILQKGVQYMKPINIENSPIIEVGLNESARLQRCIKLTYQHRMHPAISKFPRENFYTQDGIIQLNDVKGLEEEKNWPFLEQHSKVFWINTKSSINASMRTDEEINEEEINVMLRILKEFVEFIRTNFGTHKEKGKNPFKIALLCFYLRQENELRKKLQTMLKTRKKNHFTIPGMDNIEIQIGTIDRFQGQEAEVVCLSFSRTNGIGFLDSPNRLNVGLTRAKNQLILIGNKRNFEKQNKSVHLKNLATTIKSESPKFLAIWRD